MAKKIALLLSSVCFALLSGELAIRYLLRAKPFERAAYVPSYLTARDLPLRWRYSRSDGRNSLGLRNRELGPKKTGTYRIVFLGDSMIYLGETSSGELYTQVLERRLNSRFASGLNSFEVINAGVPGYTTYQELEFLKIYGIDMKPDLVVLGFVFNDLYDKYIHALTNENLLGREPTTHLHRFNTYAFPGNVFARSYLAHEVVRGSEMIWKKLRRRPMFPFEQNGDFYLAWKDYGWIQVRRLIGEMQTLLTKRGVSLAIVVFPMRDQVNDQYRKIDEAYVLYPQGKIRKISDEYAIPLLDLTEPIYRNGARTLFQDIVHLNAKGNDVLTDELEKYLEDLGIMKAQADSFPTPGFIRADCKGCAGRPRSPPLHRKRRKAIEALVRQSVDDRRAIVPGNTPSVIRPR
jgi:lysophospholipase L1-like esterase